MNSSLDILIKFVSLKKETLCCSSEKQANGTNLAICYAKIVGSAMNIVILTD